MDYSPGTGYVDWFCLLILFSKKFLLFFLSAGLAGSIFYCSSQLVAPSLLFSKHSFVTCTQLYIHSRDLKQTEAGQVKNLSEIYRHLSFLKNISSILSKKVRWTVYFHNIKNFSFCPVLINKVLFVPYLQDHFRFCLFPT